MRRALLPALAAVLGGVALLACSDGGGKEDVALFPADYALTYQEVRNCRMSLEHGFVPIRVLASPEALAPYRDRAAPFPAGAIVLKEEYLGGDSACADGPVRFTVMQKLPAGSAPDTIDWTWQEVSADRATATKDVLRCIGCHTDCGKPPDGYDGTCTVP